MALNIYKDFPPGPSLQYLQRWYFELHMLSDRLVSLKRHGNTWQVRKSCMVVLFHEESSSRGSIGGGGYSHNKELLGYKTMTFNSACLLKLNEVL